MQIIANISYEQFRTAVLAMRKQPVQKRARAYLQRIMVVILISFSITIAIQAHSDSLLDSIFAFVLLAALFAIWCRWSWNRSLRKAYDGQKQQLNGQIMSIDETGISGQWESGAATYQYRWSAFENFIELPEAFLFLPNPSSFVRIPRDSLSLEEQQIVKKWAGWG